MIISTGVHATALPVRTGKGKAGKIKEVWVPNVSLLPSELRAPELREQWDLFQVLDVYG